MATAKQIVERAWQGFRPTKAEVLFLVVLAAVVWWFGLSPWIVVVSVIVSCAIIPSLFGWLELHNEAAERDEAAPETPNEVG